MANLKVLTYFLSHPKEIISLGYQAMVRKRDLIDYEKMVVEKYGIPKLPVIDLLDLIPDFHETVDAYSFLPGTSTIVDILLLKILAKRYDNCCYLEIGSYRGESIASVAEVAGECNSLTLSPAEMRAFGFPEKHISA